MSAAELRSNSGTKSLSVELIGRGTYQHEPGYDANVQIHGEHYDGDHEHPLSFSVEGLFLAEPEISRLIASIENWIDLPLKELAVTELEEQFQFSVPGQDMFLSFGDRSDTISAQNVALSISVRSSQFYTEAVLVTDQSCLRHFCEALGEAVRQLSD